MMGNLGELEGENAVVKGWSGNTLECSRAPLPMAFLSVLFPDTGNLPVVLSAHPYCANLDFRSWVMMLLNYENITQIANIP